MSALVATVDVSVPAEGRSEPTIRTGKLLVDRIFFHAAERKSRPWHVIVAVDQSGSMLDFSTAR